MSRKAAHKELVVMKKIVGFCLLAFLLVGLPDTSWSRPKVYVIPMKGEVWPGQAKFIEEGFAAANREGVDGIILEIDTFGGLARSATSIKDVVMKQTVPVVAYVRNRALSSGALVALSCDKIAMAPGSTLGAAQPHPTDKEALSWAHTEFRSTAEARGRNPKIALAMVTAEEPMPELRLDVGDILTLSARDARRLGYADAIASDYGDVLKLIGLGSATIITYEMTPWQQITKIVLLPWVTIVLLALGMALLIIELMTIHTWGATGTLGVIMLGIVFAANIGAGTGTWIGLIVFLAGIIFLLVETHVFPGHGLSAIVGIVCVFLGLYYALGGSTTNALFTTAVASFFTMMVIIAFLIYLPRSSVWRMLGHKMQQTAVEGYVTSEDYTPYMGATGVAVTPLRPAGVGEFGGTRLDILTEGGYIPAGTPIRVVRVEGSRIIVREITGSPVQNLSADPG